MRAPLLVGVMIATTSVASVGVAVAERPLPTMIRIEPRLVPHAPTSRLVYMHRCPAAGCNVSYGDDDSRTNTSSISEGSSTLTGFRQSEEVWDRLMACVRATYAPFNIGITDVDPGTSMPHYEHMVGGRPSELRSDIPNAGGVAPFSCQEIPNAISYTFDVYGPDSDSLCWTASQEIAHAFGLEHELDNRDPMTYLTGPLPKRFQATNAQCGESAPRTCECTGTTTQNSYMHILAMFGAGAPTAPMLTIRSPTSGTKVQPHFVTRVDATDDVAVDRVELWIDGAKVAETQTLPYKLVAPDGIAEGPHTLEVRAYDVQGTPAMQTIDIVMGPPCTASKGCEGDDVCVMGVCLPGPDVLGGLGATCLAPTECISRQCLSNTEGDMHCVEPCDPATSGSCPSSFSCLETTPGAGVCWPSEGGGCCDAGGSPGGPALLALGVLAIVIRRRRGR